MTPSPTVIRLFALRYLFSRKSRSVVNVIAGLSAVAVAMPVAAMVILLSVFNGFESLVKSMYSAFDADLTLTPRHGAVFAPAAIDTAALARTPGVAAMSFVLEQSALLEHEGRQATVELRGVDERYGEVLPVAETIERGEWRVQLGELERIVMGRTLAYQLGIGMLSNSAVTLYAMRRSSFSTLLPVDSYVRRRVETAGIYSLDLDTERRYALISLALAQELFNYPGRVSALTVRLDDYGRAEAVKREVERIAGDGFRVETRDQRQATFYRIMTYEKWGIFFISLLVLIVASFSMVGALAMLILEKRDDMATLRAMGADRRTVRAIFAGEGALIAALSLAGGLALGVTLTLLQQHFGWITIPAETFLTQSYPVELHGADLLTVVAAFAAVSCCIIRLTVANMIKPEPK